MAGWCQERSAGGLLDDPSERWTGQAPRERELFGALPGEIWLLTS